MMTAEAINVETNRTSFAGPKRVGRFQLFGDALTKFYEQCVNTVVERDDLPKTEVQVSVFSEIDNLVITKILSRFFKFFAYMKKFNFTNCLRFTKKTFSLFEKNPDECEKFHS
jgi:hypothetical protein